MYTIDADKVRFFVKARFGGKKPDPIEEDCLIKNRRAIGSRCPKCRNCAYFNLDLNEFSGIVRTNVPKNTPLVTSLAYPCDNTDINFSGSEIADTDVGALLEIHGGRVKLSSV